MIRLVRAQEGHGRNRLLCVAFHVSPTSLRVHLRNSGLEHAYGVSAVTPAGGYGNPPSMDFILQQSADSGWPGGPVALIGFAAGCAGLRELLRAGARPDVVVAVDGIHGPRGQIPASPATLAPWREYASLALSGEVLFVITHTFQTYTESLAEKERFPATVNTVRAITGWPLVERAPSPVQTSSGNLFVLSYDSQSMDRAAHAEQLSQALPHVLSKYVRPWAGKPDFGVRQEGMVV